MLIKKPIITEKSISQAQKFNQYTFEVSLDADKTKAAKEIENQYKVTVEEVRTNTRLGKTYRFGKQRRQERRKSAHKYMVFTLKKGDKLTEFEL